ncbi:hypothetical protein SNEBB_003492 [Seison nebaliae]|nr:hypothetical protein SNEBB_003492 [Seison nebaliae]
MFNYKITSDEKIKETVLRSRGVNLTTELLVEIYEFELAFEADQGNIGIMQEINHRNIQKLLDSFIENNMLYLILELPHRTLEELYKDCQGTIDFSELDCRMISYQLFLALGYLHENGIMHRNVTCTNIFMFPDKLVKLSGLYYSRKGSEGFLTEYVTERMYRAPEVLVGVYRYGSEIDIWAMGIIVYRLCTSKYLIEATSAIDHIYQILKIFGPLPVHMQKNLRNTNLIHALKFDLTSGKSVNEYLRPLGNVSKLIFSCLKLDPEARITALSALGDLYYEDDTMKRNPLINNIIAKESVSTLARSEKSTRRTLSIMGYGRGKSKKHSLSYIENFSEETDIDSISTNSPKPDDVKQKIDDDKKKMKTKEPAEDKRNEQRESIDSSKNKGTKYSKVSINVSKSDLRTKDYSSTMKSTAKPVSRNSTKSSTRNTTSLVIGNASLKPSFDTNKKFYSDSIRKNSQFGSRTSFSIRGPSQLEKTSSKFGKPMSQLGARTASRLRTSMSPRKGPQSQLGGSASQRRRPTSQLGGSATQRGRPTSQLGGSVSQRGRPTSQLGKPISQMGKPTSQLGTSRSRLGMSPSNFRKQPSQVRKSTSQLGKPISERGRKLSQLPIRKPPISKKIGAPSGLSKSQSAKKPADVEKEKEARRNNLKFLTTDSPIPAEYCDPMKLRDFKANAKFIREKYISTKGDVGAKKQKCYSQALADGRRQIQTEYKLILASNHPTLLEMVKQSKH